MTRDNVTTSAFKRPIFGIGEGDAKDLAGKIPCLLTEVCRSCREWKKSQSLSHEPTQSDGWSTWQMRHSDCYILAGDIDIRKPFLSSSFEIVFCQSPRSNSLGKEILREIPCRKQIKLPLNLTGAVLYLKIFCTSLHTADYVRYVTCTVLCKSHRTLI